MLMSSVKNLEKSTKFIHASDIHLGCYQYQNGHLANDYILAFEEILSLAIIQRVDFVLLGGDVFTSLDMLPGNLIKIIDLLVEFKNKTINSIPIIAIEGNHDIRKYSRGKKFERGQSWLKIISRIGLIILLDADLESSTDQMYLPYDFKTQKGGKIQIKDVVVYGNKYIGEKPIEYFPKIRDAIIKDDGLFHVLLQHFGIQGQMKNVPGVELKIVRTLKDRVNYLALGHYHKQFIIDGWIYNPGSSEAACSLDSLYERGIFLVEFNQNKFSKIKVKKIQLNNRKRVWKKVIFPIQFNRFENIVIFIIKKLKSDLSLSTNCKPILYLVLKGQKPKKFSKFDQKSLCKRILECFSLEDVKIFQKFTNSIKTLDSYLQ